VLSPLSLVRRRTQRRKYSYDSDRLQRELAPMTSKPEVNCCEHATAQAYSESELEIEEEDFHSSRGVPAAVQKL
jgi:hypothetical protein